jgi:phytoene dehydrogenase-like protein
MSAAGVMRTFFQTDALQSPAMVAGPMVWGLSPETPGTGLGALSYAMRHVSTVGRPVGGSGMVPTSLLSAFLAHGGAVRTSARVAAIHCSAAGVSGIALDDGTQITSPLVVSACDPHSTFLSWLRNPPAGAGALIERWRATPTAQGYESKVDATMNTLPTYRSADPRLAERLGFDPLTATTYVAPSLADMDRGARLMAAGDVLEHPAFYVNIPTVLDPSMGRPGTHVLSLETLYTPYGLRGGWTGSAEPQRWIDQFATLVEPGWREGLGQWRVMTPDRYEGEFNLPRGHATSFAGGPLAALRSKSPELTRYQTAVNGLYITGAATFPGAGVWGASGRNCALTVLAGQS